MIKTLKLKDFRNISLKNMNFSEGTTIIVGPNGVGKTNTLEAIYLLATGKSFKARIEEECIEYNSDLSRINAVIERDHNKIQLEVLLTRGFLDIGKTLPERVAKKRLTINGINKRLIDFAGQFKAVLFGPWDLDLVVESPSIRRKFLDFVLSQVDREYRRASLSYDKGLRQRNKILFKIREGELSKNTLLFWNQLLIKNGNYIEEKREEFIDFVNKTDNNTFGLHYILEYDKSAISEKRLDQYKDEEVAAATTLVGPHRDDFIFKTNGKNERDLSAYGSRGEQRMGVLWLKMAELEYIKRQTDDNPTLLLDDIFSELDDKHKKMVFEITKNQQTILTTTDNKLLEKYSGNVIELEGNEP